MNELEKPDFTFDLGKMTHGELRQAITTIEVEPPTPQTDSSAEEQVFPLVRLTGLHGQDATCMRWANWVRVHAVGDLGDFAFASFAGMDVRLEGNVGDGGCEGMRRGVVKITGNAGCGLGAAMIGGTVAVYGSAGAGWARRCGVAASLFGAMSAMTPAPVRWREPLSSVGMRG